MLEDVEFTTAEVVMLKVARSFTAGTMTLAGTVAGGSLLDGVTYIPPNGAGLFSVTVPCALLPPITAVGFSVTCDTWMFCVAAEPSKEAHLTDSRRSDGCQGEGNWLQMLAGQYPICGFLRASSQTDKYVHTWS